MKRALTLVEGTILEHYEKMWLYAENIKRSNLGLNVKLHVNAMFDGKNYFSKYIYLSEIGLEYRL